MIKIKPTKNDVNDLANKHFLSIKSQLDFSSISKTEKYIQEQKYQEFVSYLEANLYSIIIGKPEQLRKHIAKISTFNINLKKHQISLKLTDHQKEENVFIDELRKIFNYNKKIEKPIFAKNLELSICPYCNREYIFKFKDNQQNELRTLAVLDHYYDKDTYPFLSLSFFNLVPSCHTCNSKFKTINNFYENLHIHPYEESFNDTAKFHLKIDSCNFYHFMDGFKIDLLPNNPNDEATKNTITTFRLNELYSHHKDIVLELIQKAEMYNESYIDELMQKYEGTLFKNREDLMHLITCGYITEEEISKRPLSKLIKDISEELDLI